MNTTTCKAFCHCKCLQTMVLSNCTWVFCY